MFWENEIYAHWKSPSATVTFGQLDSVKWDWFDEQLGRDPARDGATLDVNGPVTYFSCLLPERWPVLLKFSHDRVWPH